MAGLPGSGGVAPVAFGGGSRSHPPQFMEVGDGSRRLQPVVFGYRLVVARHAAQVSQAPWPRSNAAAMRAMQDRQSQEASPRDHLPPSVVVLRQPPTGSQFAQPPAQGVGVDVEAARISASVLGPRLRDARILWGDGAWGRTAAHVHLGKRCLPIRTGRTGVQRRLAGGADHRLHAPFDLSGDGHGVRACCRC